MITTHDALDIHRGWTAGRQGVPHDWTETDKWREGWILWANTNHTDAKQQLTRSCRWTVQPLSLGACERDQIDSNKTHTET